MLAGLGRLQKEGASNTELQVARIWAAHKAAMAYAQASERDSPEAQKFLGPEKVSPLPCPTGPPPPHSPSLPPPTLQTPC